MQLLFRSHDAFRLVVVYIRDNLALIIIRCQFREYPKIYKDLHNCNNRENVCSNDALKWKKTPLANTSEVDTELFSYKV
jgi:hypothetical protein